MIDFEALVRFTTKNFLLWYVSGWLIIAGILIAAMFALPINVWKYGGPSALSIMSNTFSDMGNVSKMMLPFMSEESIIKTYRDTKEYVNKTQEEYQRRLDDDI